jgi:ATP phosphoribosyltransferase
VHRIRLALPKGKILDESLDLLARIGVVPEEDPRTSRRLIIPTSQDGLHILVVRGWDVPTYVEYGAADAGVTGLDVLEEQGQDLYRPLDLGIGFCRMVVAEPREMARDDDPREWSAIRVATKYPNITSRHFRSKGVQADIVKISGSVELAPLTGLAARIVDLVSTGRTLHENGLVEVEEILRSTGHLVVNRASMRWKHGPLGDLTARLASLVIPGAGGGEVSS